MIVIKWVSEDGLRSISGYLPDSSKELLEYNPRHVPTMLGTVEIAKNYVAIWSPDFKVLPVVVAIKGKGFVDYHYA